MLYKVKSGDTLTSIAKKFKTDAKSISYWSRARHPSLDPESSKYSPDRLKAGWTLEIMPGQTYVPPEDVLLAADRACFVAKRRGRGHVATASEGLAIASEFELSEPTPVDPPTTGGD